MQGVMLPDTKSMANEITSFWQDTMSVKGKGLEKCRSHLNSFFGNKAWPSFDINLVLAALESPSKKFSLLGQCEQKLK